MKPILTEIFLLLYICFGSDPDHKAFVMNNKSILIRKTLIMPIILHAIIVKQSTAIEQRSPGGKITL